MSDLRAAARRLWRSPLAALGMAATLALGVAAVTATFTVVNAVVLRPLPFPGSERAVVLCETAPRLSGFCVASPPNVEDWARASRSIERFGLARDWSFRLSDGGARVSLSGGVATPGYFDVVGARAALGRLFVPADLERDRAVAVVLAPAAWRRAFGGDPGVVGRAVTVDGRAGTVVGVMADDAVTPFVDAEAWLPLTAIADDVTNRDWRGFAAIGRLAPGATLDAARKEMEVVRAALAASYPETNRDYGLEVEGLRERTAAPLRGTLLAFLAAVSCVLLIGCANVAGLMLVRGTKRGREMALRAALGAGRGRLVRETLAEGVLLAAMGAALGLLLSSLAVRAFVHLAPPGLPRIGEVALDGRALAFGTAVSFATVLLFGLAPALRASRVDLLAVVQGGGRATDGGGARLRRGLVVAQVAIAIALLASAGALGRSVAAALRWSPGFDVRRVAVVSLFARSEGHRTGAEAVAEFERAAAAVAELPGVASTAIASAGPLFGGVETAAVAAFGRPAEEGAAARWYDVGPGYFAALGLPLVAGRDFEAADGPGSRGVAIVNETLARRLWAGADPLGQELMAERERRAVVGVVRDVPPLSSAAAVTPEVFWPKRQYPRSATYLVVRAAGDPGALERAVRERLAAADPALDVGRFRTLDAALARQRVSPRFALALASAFAVVALALATVGLYGVLAFSVASRTREIGVRLALGASPARVARATVGDGLRLVLAGVVLGLPASIAAERLVAGLVPDLPPGGLGAVALAAAVFGLASLVAAGLPARRASRLDPAVALRVE